MAINLVRNAGAIEVTKRMYKGDDGGFYEPEVDADGNLSWYPSKEDMPAIATVNIKGVPGDKGIPGDKGEPGKDGVKFVHIGAEEPDDDNCLVWLYTEPDAVQSGDEVSY